MAARVGADSAARRTSPVVRAAAASAKTLVTDPAVRAFLDELEDEDDDDEDDSDSSDDSDTDDDDDDDDD